MKFIVDTDRSLIKAQGSSYSSPIKEEHLEYWQSLAESAQAMVYNRNCTVNALWYDEGKIIFGEWAPAVADEEGHTKIPMSLVPVFCFDLSSYKLCTLDGVLMNPDLLVHDLRGLRVVDGSNADPWLRDFYCYWRSLAYPSGTKKTKASYMFRLQPDDRANLRAFEILVKSGLSYSRASSFIRSLHFAKESNVINRKAHELLEVPECVYRAIVSYPELEEQCSFSDLKRLAAYTEWGSLWSAMTKLDVVDKVLLLMMKNEDTSGIFQDLIADKSYDRSRLLEYLFDDLPNRQGFGSTRDAVQLLRDYAGMSQAVHGKILEKYPKALKTEHDVMLLQFNQMKAALDDAECMKGYADVPWDQFRSSTIHHEYVTRSGEKRTAPFVITQPFSSKDIAEEGKCMHHCVASYVSIMKNDPTDLIYFMRSYEQSYSWGSQRIYRHLTLEIKNGVIVQARGIYNRDPYAKEFLFLKEFCNAKGIEMSLSLKTQYFNTVGESFDDNLVTAKEKGETVCV